MTDTKQSADVRGVAVDRLVRPTFTEWLKEMRIHMTASEAIDTMHAARRRGLTMEQFLGYPWA